VLEEPDPLDGGEPAGLKSGALVQYMETAGSSRLDGIVVVLDDAGAFGSKGFVS
jgi:hypothetical protein